MTTEWNRGDAEMAIALKRAELNRALDYKRHYDAEGHNICLALLRFNDGSIDVLAAYSNDSAIPESIRLGLDLVPDTYGATAKAERFGCDGMAQFHTEPKLLNYLCAAPTVRASAFRGPLPRPLFYRSVVEAQRKQATRHVELLKRPDDLAHMALVTEIDCCRTCTLYSVNRFRARFPNVPLQTIQLGKHPAQNIPTQFKEVRVTHRW